MVADGLGNDKVQGVEIFDLGVSPMGRLGRLLFGSIKVAFRCLKFRPDVVHFHDSELIIVGLFLRIVGIPVVYDMHENVPEDVKSKTWIPSWLRWPVAFLIKTIERIALPWFRVVIAEDSYGEFYPWLKKTTIVRNYPDYDRIERFSSIAHKEYTVGYVGGVTICRGILVVAQAISDLREKGRDVNFLCIGPVQEKVKKDELFVKGCTEGWIVATGRLMGEDAWCQVAKCKVGVAVLQNEPNYIRSYPTKLFEYMSLGVPVIVSNFPLYEQVVKESGCGFCIEPGDVATLSKRICDVIDMSEYEYDSMVACGQESARERYCWSSEATVLIDFYSDFLPGISK
ncbi:glycosyltransferase [Endozoicomonas numazuensis]|uniref:Glycosyltransferase subfamily 4-like N-terminal domain-containing protein n=1 Tax=Endozoicomonas numazuensis TaxID=1137799 RepID=A0A081N3R0_9GAMM|nr:glycosyltransferase [Endozoicomonas numazuensis]KEQ13083.1 hypothetical protein GZ78_26365 [Endozoicomonas numazuensis]